MARSLQRVSSTEHTIVYICLLLRISLIDCCPQREHVSLTTCNRILDSAVSFGLDRSDCPAKQKALPLASENEPIPNFQSPEEQRIADQCAPTPECDLQSKYRSVDGSCNNVEHPSWGQSFTPYVRLLPANYNDGKWEFRRMSSGQPLPSARLLRTMFSPINECPSDVNSVMLMFWAQLIAHDTAHLSILFQSGPDGSLLVCCDGPPLPGLPLGRVGTMLPADQLQPECMPIEVPEDDEFYSKFNVTCISVIRMATTDNLDCPLQPTQQLDEVTHFIDASQTYGSTREIAELLRAFEHGKLRHQVTDDQDFLPNVDEPTTRCNVATDSARCYQAGDNRAGQNPPLAALHTMMMREHNRLCDELAKINPSWDDEKLYQEAKRILTAVQQRITYSELIPILIGDAYSKEHGIKVKGGFEETYDPTVQPQMIHEFATAAFRIFHNLIPQNFLSATQKGCPLKLYKLLDYWNNPGIIHGEMISSIIYGMEFLPAKMRNEYYTIAVANMFEKKNNSEYGTDVIAIDIQRGRDAGLPTYVKVREACGYGDTKDFSDLSDVMGEQDIEKLQSVYNEVGDIDLMVGGRLEHRLPYSMVGPTFQCLLKEQFYRWRYGDRYFYNLKGQPGSFTEEQLNEIEKVTLSRLVCNNAKDTEEVIQDMFRLPSDKNKVVPCSEIPSLNIEFWAEN